MIGLSELKIKDMKLGGGSVEDVCGGSWRGSWDGGYDHIWLCAHKKFQRQSIIQYNICSCLFFESQDTKSVGLNLLA